MDRAIHRTSMRCLTERLEPRRLLSGWASLTVSSGQTPDTAGTMLLLSDGSVMVQGGGTSSTWNKLTPDPAPADANRYANGGFSALAAMSYQHLDYASVVLPSGNIFVAGGEYAGPVNPDGSLPRNKVEIYDPIANTWTQEQDFVDTGPGAQTPIRLSDAPSEALSDGTILVGDPFTTQTQVFDLS